MFFFSVEFRIHTLLTWNGNFTCLSSKASSASSCLSVFINSVPLSSACIRQRMKVSGLVGERLEEQRKYSVEENVDEYSSVT